MQRAWTTGWMMLFAVSLSGALACGPEYPNCDDDEDCREGEFCVNGQCQMCRDDRDCPAGQSCNGGRCEDIPGYCESDADCPSGQECQENRCVAQAVQDIPEETPDPGPQACTIDTVYFDFDSDDLDSQSRDLISGNVRCMRERGVERMHLTGYTDPRGTEEYNLALGDRRARSVLQYMTSLGVERGQLSASSVGEEMASGTDEAGWRRDRKVTFTER
ncbi:MAG TPA: OmpA family protein [Polyangiaceae bacterium LLY-WYZ-15_(1-7)]|nr:hypothetical protein [Myxococcales bacterium]MAT29483.1 hypothetical protein [Sandaracinus sp.]HJL05095.1 OmpA family protein [Polyangiaceae bacterium LLY-WYZ-15_(1-7)]MBJ70639.1 hypothetical protein [Sandaracinus sp.]HJL10594.1 OmpA family protein [Polyangiaceae bacterium LLY-WYZ-15_(1-7)]